MSDYYFHFVGVDAGGVPRLGRKDGREVRVGETLTVKGEPVLCNWGLHASKHALDAAGYTPSVARLCLVTLGGTVVHGDDKSAATERTVVAMLTVEQTDALLRAHARRVALDVAHLWQMPPVTRQFLETGDETLRAAAQAAAWASRRAARDAAYYAAHAAAAHAARDAAYYAADAAYYAAHAAPAADAAAARDRYTAWLDEMALDALEVQP